jgi:hypothetical protein
MTMKKLFVATLAILAAAALSTSASAAEIVRREKGITVTYKIGDTIQWHFGQGPNGEGSDSYVTGYPSGTVIVDKVSSYWLRGVVDQVGTWVMEYHTPYKARDGRDVESVIEDTIIVTQ